MLRDAEGEKMSWSEVQEEEGWAGFSSGGESEEAQEQPCSGEDYLSWTILGQGEGKSAGSTAPSVRDDGTDTTTALAASHAVAQGGGGEQLSPAMQQGGADSNLSSLARMGAVEQAATRDPADDRVDGGSGEKVRSSRFLPGDEGMSAALREAGQEEVVEVEVEVEDDDDGVVVEPAGQANPDQAGEVETLRSAGLSTASRAMARALAIGVVLGLFWKMLMEIRRLRRELQRAGEVASEARRSIREVRASALRFCVRGAELSEQLAAARRGGPHSGLFQMRARIVLPAMFPSFVLGRRVVCLY